MAKRFTDTDKWKRPWFRGLSLKGKVVWQFLCDTCDHAGIAIIDFELCSFQLGFKISHQVLNEELGDKVVKVDDDKYFIPSFFDFQYSHAKENFAARLSALKILGSYGLLNEHGNVKTQWGDTGGTLPPESGDSTSISIGISNIISNGSKKSEVSFLHDEENESFETFWKAWPNKVDRTPAFNAFKKHKPSIADLLSAIEKYKRLKPSWKGFMNGKTFINTGYKDVLRDDYGTEDASSNEDSAFLEKLKAHVEASS